MRERLGKWWPVLKILLGLVILYFVGKSLWHDLSEPDLWQRSYNITWLILAGALYLLGLGCTMLYWGLLLRRAGQFPGVIGLFRGYYIGFLGKYVPGKAWALLLRAAFVDKRKVNAAVAVQTGFYEVMMMMAGAGVAACILFLLIGVPEADSGLWKHKFDLVRLSLPGDVDLDYRGLALIALILATPFLAISFPLLFNRVAARLTRAVERFAGEPLTRIEASSYLRGFPMEMACWFCMGASLYFTLHPANPNGVEWDWKLWGYLTAAVALACVAGFVIIILPSGLGRS